jgi:hypothetical protein
MRASIEVVLGVVFFAWMRRAFYLLGLGWFVVWFFAVFAFAFAFCAGIRVLRLCAWTVWFALLCFALASAIC